MKPIKSPFFAALLVAIAMPTLVTAQDHPTHEHPSKQKSKQEHPGKAVHAGNSVLAKAAADGRFSKFVAAVEAAGLSEKLQGDGPFTIFAPTDEAFDKLPKGMLADLMAPANQARLAGLLANCVVPGKLGADAIKTMKATNVNGQDLALVVADGHSTVDGANVIGDELMAGNGVIHAIDAVLVPSAPVEHPEKAAPKDHPGH
jgi:uncharacterized surface protein with fasciclin (FAS1) repeats